MSSYFLTMMTSKAAGQTDVISERRLGLNSVLFRNENRESFVLENDFREEKDDRLEALLKAEVAMVPRLTAARRCGCRAPFVLRKIPLEI